MKVGILAGGLSSRLAEATEVKPKPMVEIGGWPILWHIMMYIVLRARFYLGSWPASAPSGVTGWAM
jgi:NDP-sugar pyrophosphorylase family protein